MIRLATINDMPNLLRMGQLFFDASGYSEITSFDRDDTELLLIKLIEDGCLVTDGKNAALGFVIFPMYLNTSCILAQELFWWVDKEARKTGIGVRILKEAEKIAKEKGVKAMIMLSLNDLDRGKLKNLYNKLGYKPTEQTFMRVL